MLHDRWPTKNELNGLIGGFSLIKLYEGCLLFYVLLFFFFLFFFHNLQAGCPYSVITGFGIYEIHVYIFMCFFDSFASVYFFFSCFFFFFFFLLLTLIHLFYIVNSAPPPFLLFPHVPLPFTPSSYNPPLKNQQASHGKVGTSC